MADELDPLHQAYYAGLRQLQTLLDAQSRLRAAAESALQETRKEMERLAEALCPAVVDEVRKQSPLGLSELSAHALADVILQDVQRRLSRLEIAEAASRSASQALAEARSLREENACLRDELAAARRDQEDANRRIFVLQQALEKDSPRPQIPPWAMDWQSSPSFDHDLALLSALAETGLARRADVMELLAAQLGPEITNGGLSRLLQRCASRLELIELIEVRDKRSNRATHLVRLTERGQEACRLFLGRGPAESQITALLARHGTLERALLNLEAGDLLRAAGYNIDLLPSPIETADGQSFTPDLAASLSSQTAFIKVECESRKELHEQDRVWRPYYDVTGGRFYIVAPDRATLDLLKSEVLFWLGQRPLTLWMTNLNEAGGRCGEEIWIFKRSIQPQRQYLGPSHIEPRRAEHTSPAGQRLNRT